MLLKLAALARLMRPWFWLDSIGLFALGAMVARYEGYPVDLRLYGWGTLFVLALQVMALCLNEYWDEEGDRRNDRRTPFSGGSGVLVEKLLSREAVFATAMLCLAVGIGAGAVLLFQEPTQPGVWVIMGLIFMGLFFQSSPPVALISTGYGEITTAIIFAGLVPAFSHLLLSGQASSLILLATAPLVTLHLAMLIAFGLPDFESDRASRKRTLVVRLGQVSAAALHNALLAASLAVTALGSFAGLPIRVAISAAFIAPLVVLQIITVRRLQRGEPASFFQVTLLAALLFGLGAYLTTFSFWVIG
jgi:1,4-dihydroxy-2-naphthoate octaprenyltransferase